MKNFKSVMTVAACIAACAVPAAGLVACGDNGGTVAPTVSVTYAADGSALMPLLKRGDIDYAFLAEPAATTAVNNLGKSIVMDVQAQWREVFGGDYPQACLVAKGEIVKNDKAFIDGFIAAVAASDGWAEQNPEKTVAAVKANVESGTQSTLAALTGDIISRCNIQTVAAAQAKASCATYFDRLSKLKSELGKPVLAKSPDDGFYYAADGESGVASGNTYSVYMPDGAPAIALAKLMDEGYTGASFTVVQATTIAQRVSSGTADLAIMPINAAATLYNSGKDIVMLTVNTHGNLYVVGDGDKIDLNGLADKRVGVIGQGNVPDLTLRMLLGERGMEMKIEA